MLLREHTTNLVRSQIHDLLAGLGPITPAGISETILIRDGCYCGRRFESEHGHAIWFVEENQIKVFGQDGGLAGVYDVASVQQRAA